MDIKERSALAELDQTTCECGQWSGVPCGWRGPSEQMVVVEFMPEVLRESHRAARNSGQYPHNGAVHITVERECAQLIIENDPGWAAIL